MKGVDLCLSTNKEYVTSEEELSDVKYMKYKEELIELNNIVIFI